MTSPTDSGGSEYDLISAIVACFSSSIFALILKRDFKLMLDRWRYRPITEGAKSINLNTVLNISANFSIKRLHRLLIFSRSFAKRWAIEESAYRSRKILIQSELSISSAIIFISSMSFCRIAHSPFLRFETPASIPSTFSTSFPASSSAKS